MKGANADGYLAAMEWRFAAGDFVQPGPAVAWLRMRHPLVDEEEPSGLTRTLIAADSASGISAALDWSKWLFINPDLSVYLHRIPDGEWVALDAATAIEDNGRGVTTCRLSDEGGPIGHGLQTLYVAPRPA